MLQTVGLGKMKPNTVILGFKRDWKKLCKTEQGREEVKEYVNVVHDAFELNFAVSILRFRGELDLKELANHAEEDWLAEEEVGDILPELHVSDTLEAPAEKPSSPEKEDPAKKAEEESSYVVNKGKFKVTVSKTMSEEDNEPDDKVDETTKLTDPVEPAKPEEITQEVAFKEKPKGTIDVWWLFDDGGLTILIPYLLSIHRYWKDCKLRIFTPASTHALKSNELRMATLLKRFRIDFTSVVEVEGMNAQPSTLSIQNFMKLPVKEEFPDVTALEKDRKTMRNIRLGELIRLHSKDAKLIVLTLPVPKIEMTSPLLYMSWLEVLSAASPPVLMVRGNQQNVLTFYS